MVLVDEADGNVESIKPRYIVSLLLFSSPCHAVNSTCLQIILKSLHGKLMI